MPDPFDQLARTFSATGRVILGVKPDQLDDPTPCAEWTLRDLVNHVVGGLDTFRKAAAGEPNEFDFQTKPPDVIGDDPSAAYDERAAACLAAWRARGNIDGVVPLLGNDSPAAMAWGVNMGDSLIHGWDVARATGQDYVVDDDVVETTFSNLNGQVPDGSRGPGKPFGAVVPVDDTAPTIDKLVAYMGRTP